MAGTAEVSGSVCVGCLGKSSITVMRPLLFTVILVLTFDTRPPENHSTVFSLFQELETTGILPDTEEVHPSHQVSLQTVTTIPRETPFRRRFRPQHSFHWPDPGVRGLFFTHFNRRKLTDI